MKLAVTILALCISAAGQMRAHIPFALGADAPQAQSGAPVCDTTLWQHVYAGDPHRFATPQDRLHVITPCLSVTGVVDSFVREPDGDIHIRLRLDVAHSKLLLNAKNISEQGTHLVVEPICELRVTQADTIKEKACTGYQGHLWNDAMLHKTVEVVGAYVQDMEHGWMEIHPPTSITVTK